MADENLTDAVQVRAGVKDRGEPFVQLFYGEEGDRVILGELMPHEARDLARGIMEGAEAAEQYALLLDFARDITGCDLPAAIGMLGAYQEKHGKVPDDGSHTLDIERTPRRHVRRQNRRGRN